MIGRADGEGERRVPQSSVRESNERTSMTGIDIKPDAQGKVRDLYDLGDKLLLVATDRISAFDYILEDEIPHKGAVLTQLSCFWFELLDGVVENHLISSDVADLPEQFQPYADYLRGRFMLVKKADMFPVECIVRGYLAGSGLKEYQKQGAVCGIELPEGLVNSSSCPSPSSRPPPRPRSATTTRTSATSAAPRSSARTTRRAARPVAEGIHDRARPCGRARRDHRRHQVRVRRAGRQDHPGRRGAHPR